MLHTCYRVGQCKSVRLASVFVTSMFPPAVPSYTVSPGGTDNFCLVTDYNQYQTDARLDTLNTIHVSLN